MKVLIVEDNAIMRDFLSNLISELTAHIWQAVDGLEAVASAREYKPDVILMDIRMPELDGIEATRRIMQDNPVSNVVIVTEFDNLDLRRAALEAGAIAYVLKDNLQELPETLVRLLNLN